jgi:hypothetical protein
MISRIRRLVDALRGTFPAKLLPEAVRATVDADRSGVPGTDPGSDAVILACMSWMARAQDLSLYRDGGVARHFSPATGWSASYPETTGYIVPTFLDQAERRANLEWRERARRMLDWLVGIQLPDGAFQGGMVDSQPVTPVAFNTGQILMGLAAGQREFGAYGEALRAAGDWLVRNQDPDGCWRKGASPFAAKGDKAYDTHIAWGLLEAARVEPGRGYAESAMANVRWALTHQRENGWMAQCCLSVPASPLTHTLGYALRGMLEAHRFAPDGKVLDAARKLADGILSALRHDGFLPGQLRSNWSAASSWACLTGTAQVAHCWLILYQTTGDQKYLAAGKLANSFVRRTVALSGSQDTVGAVRGSFPFDGNYCRFQYPNWAAKFLVDSLTIEESL